MTDAPETGTGTLGQVRLWGTALLVSVALLLLLPFHLAGVAIGGRAASAVTVLWHRFVVKVLGLRIRVTGRIAADRPLLLLSNHISWLDIPVLASVAPISFVAKREVAGWGVFGWLAKLQRSVFVDRERRHRTGSSAAEVGHRLSQGDLIVLFAEGTSSDGNRVLPFRSALVGSAQRLMDGSADATLQPVAIAYTRMLGLPLGRQHRSQVAWYGDMELLPHLAHLLQLGALDVEIVLGPPIRLPAGHDRKHATARAGRLVRRLVAGLNAGREPAVLLAALAETEARPARALAGQDGVREPREDRNAASVDASRPAKPDRLASS
ncbi:lysophospholipid acyltransferase family protein [Faunimonas sp. B44]|uniref:lysophospholipid acyltransferase family protein n=1 Tax=Faunimonas sp. B44 TaxID=3461493 RepID=UPI00404490DD